MIRKVKKNQKVFTQKDKSREMYYIEKGSIKIQQHNEGKTTELAILEKGALFGEMAVIDGKPRSATAIAIEDSELIVVTSEDFKQKVMSVPPWYLAIIRVTSERLRQANERLNTGQRLDNIANIAQLLVLFLKKNENKSEFKVLEEESAGIDLKEVKKELMDILGIGRNHMTEALDFLEKKNLILMFSNALSVADINELNNYSKFLKSLDSETDMQPIDNELHRYLNNLKNILDDAFSKMEIITFSYTNFKTDLKENLDLPDNKLDWFLSSLQKLSIVKFVLSDGSEADSVKFLESNGQLRFDYTYLKKFLQNENFKRMGF
ncbi:MAG: Crp/Fnr family transcriptional regulator [Fibrobacteria bacterium]|nr:Crp/Fnr family transcriptional regulator [Fibrobacteria bacterium]